MKKLIFPLILLIIACRSIPPTPNDFPPPPMTVIVEFPTPGVPTPTPQLNPLPISHEKMADAQTFLLILYTRALSGDDHGIAESVKYPITVNLPQPTTISNADDFVAHYDEIFNRKIMDVLENTDSENLIYLPEGIRVGYGELWFNLFCTDVTCKDTQFLITQINN